MPLTKLASGSVAQHRVKLLLAFISLIFLGVSWSVASPLGSSADEPFHASSIWCAWGESKTCALGEDGVSASVPGAISKSTCYISWPAVSGAGCLDNFIKTSEYNTKLVTTTGLSLDSTYSPIYYKVTRVFVGLDVEGSILSIRIFNVILGSLLFLFALIVATPSIKRALALSWGLALIPMGIFFLASINPSSWMIAAIGTYWAFLSTALSTGISRTRWIYAWLGVLLAAFLAIGARTDAVLYLAVTSFAIGILRWNEIRSRLNRGALSILVLFIAAIGAIGAFTFFRRFTTNNLSWGSDVPSGSLPVPLKTLAEMPSFVVGLFGGQSSYSEWRALFQSNPGDRVSGFTYGLGWTEFDIPAYIGVIGVLSTFSILFITLKKLSLRRAIALGMLVTAFATIVLLTRATTDFQTSGLIQPRYLFPLFLGSLGIALLIPTRPRPLLSNPQLALVVGALFISGSIAWLATATRYAVGPLGVLTDFGQPYEWWWHIGPGRLGWFIFTVLVTGLWLYSTVWVYGRLDRSNLNSSLQEIEAR